MSPRPKTYRFCRYDAANMVVSADWIQAASDEEAIAMATEACFGAQCELWDGNRLVAQLEADRQQA
jgi:hypothetical protein